MFDLSQIFTIFQSQNVRFFPARDDTPKESHPQVGCQLLWSGLF